MPGTGIGNRKEKKNHFLAFENLYVGKRERVLKTRKFNKLSQVSGQAAVSTGSLSDQFNNYCTPTVCQRPFPFLPYEMNLHEKKSYLRKKKHHILC